MDLITTLVGAIRRRDDGRHRDVVRGRIVDDLLGLGGGGGDLWEDCSVSGVAICGVQALMANLETSEAACLSYSFVSSAFQTGQTNLQILVKPAETNLQIKCVRTRADILMHVKSVRTRVKNKKIKNAMVQTRAAKIQYYTPRMYFRTAIDRKYIRTYRYRMCVCARARPPLTLLS